MRGGAARGDRDVSAAKRAAENGPVTITDHGHRSHVLLTADYFDRLSSARELVGDRLWARGTEGIGLELPARRVEFVRSWTVASCPSMSGSRTPLRHFTFPIRFLRWMP